MAQADAHRHGSRRLDLIALVVALAPIVIAGLRAGATGWVPQYDAAYFTARSLDVFTEHQPFVGAWSTLSAQLNESFNNLGPIQLLSLAPFTRLEPFWGTAIAVALVNGLSVFAVWKVACVLFSTRGCVGVMLATVAIEMSFGGLALIDPRQQLALLLPFWAFLWLTVAMACGYDGAILPWVAAGTFVLQTHFSYAYLGMLLVVTGAVGYFISGRRRWRERTMWARVTAGLGFALVLWALPLWDQFVRSGNISHVVTRAGGREPSGLNTGAQILADSPLSPSSWLPGSLDSFRTPWSYSPLVSWLILAFWFVALAIVALLSHRRGRPDVTVMTIVALGALAVALATAARIPTSAFGLLPQNYFWMWPIAFFSMVVLGAELLRRIRLPSIRPGILVLVTSVVAVPALQPTQAFATWDVGPEITGIGGRPLLDEIGDNLAELQLDPGSAVLVEPTDQRLLFPDYYNVLGVFIREGVDIHFPTISDDLNRFGEERCEDGSEHWRLRIVVGPDRPPIGPHDVVLGRRDGMDPAAAVELWVLRSQVNQWLSDGDFRVDVQRLHGAGDAGTEIARILDVPGWPHADLWFYLPTLVEQAIAAVPKHHRAAYDRWLVLERSTLAVDLIVYLTPNWLPAACPS